MARNSPHAAYITSVVFSLNVNCDNSYKEMSIGIIVLIVM